jgi:hypothetical protein
VNKGRHPTTEAVFSLIHIAPEKHTFGTLSTETHGEQVHRKGEDWAQFWAGRISVNILGTAIFGLMKSSSQAQFIIVDRYSKNE